MHCCTLQAGDRPGARAVLEEMRDAGAPPNAVTYTILVDAEVRTGNLKVCGAALPTCPVAAQTK